MPPIPSHDITRLPLSRCGSRLSSSVPLHAPVLEAQDSRRPRPAARPESKPPRPRPTAGARKTSPTSNASKTAAGARKKATSATPAQPSAKPKANDEEATAAGDEEQSMVSKLVATIREHGVVILSVLVGLLIAVGAWAKIGRKSDRGVSIDPSRSSSGGHSSTRIRAADVNARLDEEPDVVETDGEYALVVEEEALKMPPLPDGIDELTGRQYAESSDIRKLLEEKRFPEAYDCYMQRIARDTSLEFHSQLEHSLSEYFIRTRDFDKAANVLKHHVATHAGEEISADTYFNLGYVSVFRRRPDEGQRYFKLFAEKETDSARVERARRVIGQLSGHGGPRS